MSGSTEFEALSNVSVCRQSKNRVAMRQRQAKDKETLVTDLHTARRRLDHPVATGRS
jgi:hypothetical protein